MGKVYMMVAIAILPVIIVYLLLSKFIARGRCFRFPHESPKRAFAISQDKRFVQHEPHLPVIGNAARLHANELRPFLILLPYYNSPETTCFGLSAFFPIYKTELNQYNKVRSIKHRRRPS